MNNGDYYPVNDAAFENMLKSSVPFEPPEEIVKAVTPWKKAIKRVIWGLALSTLTLNICYLNYILPVVGMILSLLGLRVLRRENKWFRTYYVVTIIATAYKWFIFSYLTTVTYQDVFPEMLFTVLTLIILFAQLMLFCLSLNATAKKAEIKPPVSPMIGLIVWYIIVVLLGLMNYKGFVIPIAMIIGFIFIIRSLYKISSQIDEIGYSIENATIKLKDSVLSLMLVSALISSLTCGYAFFSDYKMQWQVKDKNEHLHLQQIKENLIELGFPESILEDMTADDILACEGATKVVVDTEQLPFNDDTRIIQVTEQITPYFSSTYDKIIHDVEEMTVTGVGVCLTQEPDGDGDWMLIHHFCWDVNPGFYGTECIQLFPAYRNQNTRSYSYVSEPTGRVLYTKDGVDYVSPYHSLGSEQYTSENIIFGKQTNNDIFATFSLPGDSERQRGYVMYAIADNSEHSSIIDSWITYNHQLSFLQYPAETAKENRKGDLFSNSIAFRNQQWALQIADREIM